MDLERILMQMNSAGKCPVPGAAVGEMPCEAAIGMTYTPMQHTGSERYDPFEALSHGTLYPGLDLPLMNDRSVPCVAKTPLGELQALNFCIVELGLYLDTHPNDGKVLELYRAYQESYKAKREAYVKNYGPISRHDVIGCGEYAWINDPWPWDLANRRGA